MARRLVQPQFPIPPREYDQRYLAEIVRAFSLFLEQTQNPGEERATTITLTALPTSDFGLETGALFQQDGFVKIALANAPNVVGSSSSGGVGTVTVTIS